MQLDLSKLLPVKYIFSSLLGILLLSASGRAQNVNTDSSAKPSVTTPRYERAFGVRFGRGSISHERDYSVLNGFYDIPIGHIVFSPELKFYLADPLAFGMETRFKFGLWKGEAFSTYGSLSTEIEIWETRVSLGLPVSLLLDFPVLSKLEFEVMATADPLLFLGVSGRAIFFGIFAGVRIPVSN